MNKKKYAENQKEVLWNLSLREFLSHLDSMFLQLIKWFRK